jgi:tetrahydromethanopterin S-methyltransferase subunit F
MRGGDRRRRRSVGTWSARLGYAIGLVFAGAYIVVLAVVLAGMLVGATVRTGLIGRDAALHVLAAAQATEPEVLLRNISVGTALAVLVPLVAVLLWRRSQSAERSSDTWLLRGSPVLGWYGQCSSWVARHFLGRRNQVRASDRRQLPDRSTHHSSDPNPARGRSSNHTAFADA